jgi:hypothetical protein
MAGYPREALMAALLCSLIASSAFVGTVNYVNAIGSIPSLEQGALPGQISMAGFGNNYGFITSSQDYTSSTGWSSNVTVQSLDSTIPSGCWTQSSSGYTLTSIGLAESDLVVIGIQPDTDNVYTVSYVIDNVPDEDFWIYPRAAGTPSAGLESNLQLVFAADGVHLKDRGLFYGFGIYHFGDDYFFPYPNARTTASGGTTIQTTLDENQKTLAVSIDNQNIGTATNVRPLQSSDISFGVYYGATGSGTVGYTLKSVGAKINTAGLSTQTWTTNPTDYFTLIASIFGISQYSIVPWWAILIVIMPQLAAIAYMLAELLRGD